MISGMNLSSRLEISLSLLVFSAQYNMIANGNIEVKTNETNSSSGKSPRSLIDNDMHIIKKRGMQIIGGLVKVDTVLYNFCFEFMF